MALLASFARVAYFVWTRTFAWLGAQTFVYYMAVLGTLSMSLFAYSHLAFFRVNILCVVHMGELLIIYFELHYESQSYAWTNMLLSWAYVALLWIWHIRLRAVGLKSFRGSWFFLASAAACAILTAIRAMVIVIGAASMAAREQAKLIVRLLLGPTQMITAVGLIVYALRFRFAGNKSVRGRMSKQSQSTLARISALATLGALGFGLLVVVNSMAVDYQVLSENPVVLITYYCIRYMSSTTRCLGLMIGLRLDHVAPLVYMPRRKDSMGAVSFAGTEPKSLAPSIYPNIVGEQGLTPDDFEDDWDPEKTFGAPSLTLPSPLEPRTN